MRVKIIAGAEELDLNEQALRSSGWEPGMWLTVVKTKEARNEYCQRYKVLLPNGTAIWVRERDIDSRMKNLKVIVYHDGKDYQTIMVERTSADDWAEMIDRLVGGVNWFESFAGASPDEAIQDAIANGFVYKSKEEMDELRNKRSRH